MDERPSRLIPRPKLGHPSWLTQVGSPTLFSVYRTALRWSPSDTRSCAYTCAGAKTPVLYRAHAYRCRRMSRAFNKASRRIPQHSERNVSRERGLLRHKFLLARYERRRHLERVVYHRLTLYSSQDYTNVRVRTFRHHSKYAFASSILARFTKSLERRTSTGVMDNDD